MAIKPLGDRVLIEPKTEAEEKLEVYMFPDTAKEKQQEGKVIEVGSGRYEDGS